MISYLITNFIDIFFSGMYPKERKMNRRKLRGVNQIQVTLKKSCFLTQES